MNQQYKLPLFPEDLFDKIKEAYALQEVVKLQKEVEHLKHVVAGFKGYRTKRKSKNQNHEQNRMGEHH